MAVSCSKAEDESISLANETFAILDVEAVNGATLSASRDRATGPGEGIGGLTDDYELSEARRTFTVEGGVERIDALEVLLELRDLVVADGWTMLEPLPSDASTADKRARWLNQKGLSLDPEQEARCCGWASEVRTEGGFHYFVYAFAGDCCGSVTVTLYVREVPRLKANSH